MLLRGHASANTHALALVEKRADHFLHLAEHGVELLAVGDLAPAQMGLDLDDLLRADLLRSSSRRSRA